MTDEELRDYIDEIEATLEHAKAGLRYPSGDPLQILDPARGEDDDSDEDDG